MLWPGSASLLFGNGRRPSWAETTFGSRIRHWTAAQVVSTVWLPCMTQPRTFALRLWCGCVFLSPGDIARGGSAGGHGDTRSIEGLPDCLP